MNGNHKRNDKVLFVVAEGFSLIHSSVCRTRPNFASEEIVLNDAKPFDDLWANADFVVIRLEFRKQFVEKDHSVGRVNHTSELDSPVARREAETVAIWASTLSDVHGIKN
jgi:hypothetical protein